jgi:hypothetical protein
LKIEYKFKENYIKLEYKFKENYSRFGYKVKRKYIKFKRVYEMLRLHSHKQLGYHSYKQLVYDPDYSRIIQVLENYYNKHQHLHNPKRITWCLALYFHFSLPRRTSRSIILIHEECHLEAFTFEDLGAFAAGSTVI